MKKITRSLSIFLLLITLLCTLTACSLADLAENPYFAQGKPGETPPSATPGEETVHTWSAWVTDETTHKRTCTTCGETEEDDHTPTSDSGYNATCGQDGLTDGSHCAVCSYILTAQEVIPATGEHDYVACEIIPPTFTDVGYIAAEQCKICHTVNEATADNTIPAFRATCGSYGYDALADKTDGEKLQAFYAALYDACVAFHTDADTDAFEKDDYWVAFTIPYSSYEITKEQAFEVLHTLQADCPIFYWIGNLVAGDSSLLYVYTEPDYASGILRSACNEQIYDGILEIGYRRDSAFALAFYLNDLLVEGMDYAYEADGVTPSRSAWAHNILGYFSYGAGVCETYAETFSLFLNYWGVENAIVTGYAGAEAHAWNVAQMEDGGWYWFDITWNDQPTVTFGKIYNYFCKTDAEFALSERTIDTALYAPPTRSETSYVGDTVGTAFSFGAHTYVIIGYGEVELTESSALGTLDLHALVSYNSRSYELVSVGKLEGNTLMPVFASGVTSVYLPETVRHIRGNAFSVRTLTEVLVSADNPYLLSEGGVAIYRRDPCVLVCYLPTATATTLTLRADTVGIDSWAILNGNVTVVELPATLSFIDTYAFYDTNASLELHFDGTVEEWNALDKDTFTLPQCSVVCSDGSVSLSP